MFGEREARPVVLRGASGERLHQRVLWWVGLRVVVAREGWAGTPFWDFLWLPGPADLPDSTMTGVVCRFYAPVTLVLVAAGCVGGWLLGGALAALAGVLVTVLLVAGHRYVRARQRRLPTVARPDDQRLLADTGRRAAQVLRDWPTLGDLAAGLRPQPVLEDALWDLAGVLATRSRVRDVRDQLTSFGRSETASGRGERDGDLRARATALVANADRRLAALDREVRARAGSIADLAERCHLFAAHQRATARLDELAGRLHHALDGQPAVGGPDPAEPLADLAGPLVDPAEPLADPAGRLAGHVAAVLDAYRELSAAPGLAAARSW